MVEASMFMMLPHEAPAGLVQTGLKILFLAKLGLPGYGEI